MFKKISKKSWHLVQRVIQKIKIAVKTYCRCLSYLGSKNVFVFGSPFHCNAGDQAQTFCIIKWFEAGYPTYKIRLFNALDEEYNRYLDIRIISKMIKKSDKIVLHSGYHTTDIYPLESKLQRKVIEAFPSHKIIVFPQTIFYETDNGRKIDAEIFNKHNDILLMCRDNVSYNLAQEIFPSCTLALVPDIVTSLIGCYHFDFPRKGILLCVRNDRESLLTEERTTKILKALSSIDEVSITDTTLPVNYEEFSNDREAVLTRVWKEYAKYRVIVTDRYHGTIFSLIANTPVIVLPSTDHKLKSGVDWLTPVYGRYVRFVDQIELIPAEVQKVLDDNFLYSLSPYFKEKYYDKLKEKIEA